jgi:hypothetical protein
MGLPVVYPYILSDVRRVIHHGRGRQVDLEGSGDDPKIRA